jgi:hypothetical protein
MAHRLVDLRIPTTPRGSIGLPGLAEVLVRETCTSGCAYGGPK